MIKTKRIYEIPSSADGKRVLVERLWPRGFTRERAAVDIWLKEIAPSPELRKWFGHDPQKWAEFRKRYRAELKVKPELLDDLQAMAAEGPLTLVYSARNPLHNSAVLLKEFLEERQPS